MQVVVVFYAAIILILVGTNIHRFRRAANGSAASGVANSPPKQQIVVRLDHKEKAYQVSASPDEIKAEIENQDTDGALV